MTVLAVLAVLPAGCGSSVAPTPASERPTLATPSTAVAPTSSPSVEATANAECGIVGAPGPEGAPQGGGDLVDTSDMGGGRWSLCLTVPWGIVLEGSAACRWDPARGRPIEVDGLPTRLGTVDYSAWVQLGPIDGGMSLTDWRAGSGTVATYRPVGSIDIRATEGGRSGTLRIGMELLSDPESGSPAGVPPGLLGMMRWRCGDPPPP